MQLAIEAEAAILKISLQEQDYYRYLVAHNIKKLEQGGRRKNKYKSNEWKIMKEIKNKIQKHNLIITKADKGKTIVIMSLQQYQQHTQKFIQENTYEQLPQDPTKSIKE
jgi:hypothetical protein